jgi:hypothetical protein|nr:MAG TPA: hypothetical protein [Caudoviricetes sp.]
MIEFLKKLVDEGIKVSIDTDIHGMHGMMKITLTHRDNHSYYFADLKELVQLCASDDDFIEILHHTYYELKKFEAKQNDL